MARASIRIRVIVAVAFTGAAATLLLTMVASSAVIASEDNNHQQQLVVQDDKNGKDAPILMTFPSLDDMERINPEHRSTYCEMVAKIGSQDLFFCIATFFRAKRMAPTSIWVPTTRCVSPTRSFSKNVWDGGVCAWNRILNTLRLGRRLDRVIICHTVCTRKRRHLISDSRESLERLGLMVERKYIVLQWSKSWNKTISNTLI